MSVDATQVLDRLSVVFGKGRNASERVRFVLPMLFLARLDWTLSGTKGQLIQALRAGEIDRAALRERRPDAVTMALSITQRPYYNMYEKSLREVLAADEQETAQRFQQLIADFDARVRQRLYDLDLKGIPDRLSRAKRLLEAVRVTVDEQRTLSVVNDHAFGEILHDILQLLTEGSSEKAGDCATPTDLADLACAVLHHHGGPGQVPILRVYDPACGTGGLLLAAAMRGLSTRPNAQAIVRGHEVKEMMAAIADLYLLLRTRDVFSGDAVQIDQQEPPTSVEEGNALLDPGAHLRGGFHYIVCNPPMGADGKWSDDGPEKIKAEHERGVGGRFAAGLPTVTDSSLLFVQHIVAKLASNGRAVMLMNASPLFEGEPSASKNSQSVRLWLLEQDLLEAVISLPGSVHYNTGIGTYLWVLDKNKAPERRGKILLVNAARTTETAGGRQVPVYASPLARNQNEKRFTLKGHVDTIVGLYADALTTGHPDVRVLSLDDVRFRAVKLWRALQMWFSVTEEGLERLHALDVAEKQPDRFSALVAWLRPLRGEHAAEPFLAGAERAFGAKLPPALRKGLIEAFGRFDPSAPVLMDGGKPVRDPTWEDSERVPWSAPDAEAKRAVIEAYLDREVRPYLEHEVYYDLNDVRDGCEINFNQFFYRYTPPRPLETIEAELAAVRAQVDSLFAAPAAPSPPPRPSMPRWVTERRPTQAAVPVYDLRVAAGRFSGEQDPEPLGWVELRGAKARAGQFVAQVVGTSMNKLAPDGSWALWEHLGAYGVAAAANGDAVLVRRSEVDPHLGRFTFKRLRVSGDTVRLVPESTDTSHEPLPFTDDDRIVARFLATVGDDGTVLPPPRRWLSGLFGP